MVMREVWIKETILLFNFFFMWTQSVDGGKKNFLQPDLTI